MPDHLHLLVQGLGQSSDMRRFVERLKQRSGYAHARHSRQELWQKGYYDHVLRDEEETVKVARYILGNPVRGGLVDRIDDYPHIGSDVFDLTEIFLDLAPSGRRG